MIMSNLCSMSFAFLVCFFTASLWGLAWDYQGHVTLPCCTLAFTFSTLMPKASNVSPMCLSTVSTSGCCLTLFIMSPSMWWAQAYLCCLAWLLDFLRRFGACFGAIVVSLMTGRLVTHVPRLLLWEAGDIILPDHAVNAERWITLLWSLWVRYLGLLFLPLSALHALAGLQEDVFCPMIQRFSNC